MPDDRAVKQVLFKDLSITRNSVAAEWCPPLKNGYTNIFCECHKGHPAENGGDYLCPQKTNPSDDIDTIKPLKRHSSESPGLRNGTIPPPEETNSRVISIRRLFEEQTNSKTGARAPLTSDSSSATDDEKPADHRRIVANRASRDPMGNDDTSKFYRSHTQIVDIPNGVKIITTIHIDDNLGPEEPSAFETVIYPESEIIKRFEQDCGAIVKRS
ncbi:uncharacterized protein LOC129729013 [Wyeomyia smithii]|uniref:uncharacterized protein LOC129729013 n=1 Tax=Wyeomyia smithii TaxID=174621 RepID=UPI002467FDDA|nr:uncharacterized protein LOC129729013 [Wyeomyia smithii]